MKRLGGGSRNCSICGETTFGSVEHLCKVTEKNKTMKDISASETIKKSEEFISNIKNDILKNKHTTCYDDPCENATEKAQKMQPTQEEIDEFVDSISKGIIQRHSNTIEELILELDALRRDKTFLREEYNKKVCENKELKEAYEEYIKILEAECDDLSRFMLSRSWWKSSRIEAGEKARQKIIDVISKYEENK